MEKQEFLLEITNGIKSAMIAKDKIRLETLRSINNAMVNAEKKENAKEVNYIDILVSLAKQRQQSIDEYSKAREFVLANNELEELTIIESFMSPKLTDEQIAVIVKEMLQTEYIGITMKEQGKVINAFKTKYPGQNTIAVINAIKANII